VTCYYCGKRGHYSTKCPKKPSSPDEQRDEQPSNPKKKECHAKRVEVPKTEDPTKYVPDATDDQKVLN